MHLFEFLFQQIIFHKEIELSTFLRFLQLKLFGMCFKYITNHMYFTVEAEAYYNISSLISHIPVSHWFQLMAVRHPTKISEVLQKWKREHLIIIVFHQVSKTF